MIPTRFQPHHLGLVGALFLGLLTTTPAAERTATPPECLAPQDKEGKQDPVPGPNSAQNCGQCHTEIYQEWKGRAHAIAWTDKIYQESLKGKKRPKVCHGCHIPKPVLERLGKRPKPRLKDKHEGVTCVTCHLKQGKIHGPFGSKLGVLAHPVVKDPTFTPGGVYALCASCHNKNIGPVLDVANDFKKSGLEQNGKSCIGCHMPEVERHIAVSPVTKKPVEGQKKRKGRSHAMLGPKDKDFVASAFGLKVKKAGKKIEVLVENGAGHKVPGLKLRDFVFYVRQLDAKGKEVMKGKFTINYENLLKVLETRHFPLPASDKTKKVEVRVEHKLNGELVAEILKKTLALE